MEAYAGVDQSDDMIMVDTTTSNLLFEKAKPQKSESKKKDKKKKKQAGINDYAGNDEFNGAVELLALDVNDNDGSAYSFVFGYGHDFANKLSFDVALPYRYSNIDDEIDSESHYLGLNLSCKYPFKEWTDKDITWYVGSDIFGSFYSFSTDDILERAGRLKYGAGFFNSLTKKLNFGILSLGVDYKISKAYTSSSMFSVNNEFASYIDTNEFTTIRVNYTNNLDPVHTLSYGFNMGMPFMDEKAAANFEVLRSNFFSDDIGNSKDSQTTAGISGSYYPTETFELSLGLRSTFELKDIDILGLTLGVIHKF